MAFLGHSADLCWSYIHPPSPTFWFLPFSSLLSIFFCFFWVALHKLDWPQTHSPSAKSLYSTITGRWNHSCSWCRAIWSYLTLSWETLGVDWCQSRRPGLLASFACLSKLLEWTPADPPRWQIIQKLNRPSVWVRFLSVCFVRGNFSWQKLECMEGGDQTLT